MQETFEGFRPRQVWFLLLVLVWGLAFDVKPACSQILGRADSPGRCVHASAPFFGAPATGR